MGFRACLGFGVWGLGLRVWGSGFAVCGLEIRGFSRWGTFKDPTEILELRGHSGGPYRDRA